MNSLEYGKCLVEELYRRGFLEVESCEIGNFERRAVAEIELERRNAFLDYCVVHEVFGCADLPEGCSLITEVEWGGSEGIYLDVYLCSKQFVNQKEHFMTFKTLKETAFAMRIMKLIALELECIWGLKV